MDLLTPNSAAAAERWERDYTLVRDALMKVKKGEDSRVVDAKIKQLERDLAVLVDDGTLSFKRRKLADLVRSLLLRQADGTVAKSTPMSSSSSQQLPLTSTDTQGQSTEQLLEEQNAAFRKQDRALEGISRNISELHTVSRTIGETADLHVRLLDNIDEETHGVNAAIKMDNRRVRDVSAASDTRSLRCTIFLLAALLILMILLKI